jgi:hypothetical protein
MSSKGGRRPNFSESEREVLTLEVEKRKKKLFGKFSSTLSKEVKVSEWKSVAGAVNKVSSHNGGPRTAAEVEVCWKNLRTNSKKILGTKMNTKSMNQTGGGEAAEPLNSYEVRMMGIIGKTSVSGITGGFDTSNGKSSLYLNFTPIKIVNNDTYFGLTVNTTCFIILVPFNASEVEPNDSLPSGTYSYTYRQLENMEEEENLRSNGKQHTFLIV